MLWTDGSGPNFLDDGGDATLLVHKGVEYESGMIPAVDSTDNGIQVVLSILHAVRRKEAIVFGMNWRRHRGVSEKQQVHRLIKNE